ncbi:U2 snRNP-associated SURP motif-containing protein-like [Oscarella lobularis]|uniref:U2 snRNP-associated SURP motif-containing protein-like n=1 Tax=Oscarella lobularis TaxID=121494 RepID=UPI00331447F9
MASRKGWMRSNEMQHKISVHARPKSIPKAQPISAARKKEMEEEKKKQEAERAAAVYAEFVAEFENPTAQIKTFVRGSTINPDTKEEAENSAGSLYRHADKISEFLKVDKEKEGTGTIDGGFPLPKPELPKKRSKEKEKKKSNLELFKEELKRSQEEREERHKLKRKIVEGSAALGQPPPYIPEPTVPGQGSLDFGDPCTTNLYVGNIHPKMNEESLCHYFGKYGPLASIKIMWPRNEEERSRGSNCGFVAYMKREDAERAINGLRDKEILGLPLKVGWGKAVPLPLAPFYVPPEMRQQNLPAVAPPPTGLPFNAQARPRPGMGFDARPDLEECIVRVIIPHDKELLALIHRTIEFVIREGSAFEAIIMQREISNPTFQFLFRNDSPEHVYYRWKLFSILQGDPTGFWRTEAFQMFSGGSLWQPPPSIHHKEPERPPLKDINEPKRGELTDKERDQLENMLRKITPERNRVADMMLFCLDHSEAADEIVDCISESLGILQTPVPIKVARVYLVSDILYNCSSCPVPNSSYYRKGFEAKLPEISSHLHDTLNAITGRMRAEQFKRQIMSCLRSWEEWALYSPQFLIQLQNNFLGVSAFEKPVAEDVGISNVVAPKSADVDGTPFEQEDVDGVPMEDLDGIPIDERSGSRFGTAEDVGNWGATAAIRNSKWERDDDADAEPAQWQSRPRFSSSSSGFGDSVLRQPGGGGGGGGGSLEDEERRQRLREIEVKVMQYADQMEREGGSQIGARVQAYRERLLEDLSHHYQQHRSKKRHRSRSRSRSPKARRWKSRSRSPTERRRRSKDQYG